MKGERAMEGMSLFKIVANQEMLDLTNHIAVPSYEVNNKPKYNEWNDADLIGHRVILRYYLDGSFTLLFTDPDEYQEFLEFYKDALVDGYVNAYVYSNNDRELKLTQVFMDFELADEMPFMGIKEIDGIEVKIRER